MGLRKPRGEKNRTDDIDQSSYKSALSSVAESFFHRVVVSISASLQVVKSL